MGDPLQNETAVEIDVHFEQTGRGTWTAKFWLISRSRITDPFYLEREFRTKEAARAATIFAARTKIAKDGKAIFANG